MDKMTGLFGYFRRAPPTNPKPIDGDWALLDPDPMGTHNDEVLICSEEEFLTKLEMWTAKERKESLDQFKARASSPRKPSSPGLLGESMVLVLKEEPDTTVVSETSEEEKAPAIVNGTNQEANRFDGPLNNIRKALLETKAAMESIRVRNAAEAEAAESLETGQPEAEFVSGGPSRGPSKEEIILEDGRSVADVLNTKESWELLKQYEDWVADRTAKLEEEQTRTFREDFGGADDCDVHEDHFVIPTAGRGWSY